ncbi:MAG: pseudouridine synthase [Terriglobales bacterium]
MSVERLQKIIAAAGIASRRRAEVLITSGRVSVNGQIVSELGSKADPESDHIRVDGKLLRGPERHVYLVLNKPKGYVTTVTDPEGRPTVMNLVRGVKARVYPVGRLDYLSEGLLLMTNDGALVERLMHASTKVPKTYWVKVSGTPSEEAIEKLRRGIVLPPRLRARALPGKGKDKDKEATVLEGKSKRPSVPRRGEKAVKTAPAKIRLLKEAANPWYEVTLIEGRNRQIRRMFKQVGHDVEKIKRVRYGPLELDVESGKFRPLTVAEVGRLKAAVRQRAPARGKAPNAGTPRHPGDTGQAAR